MIPDEWLPHRRADGEVVGYVHLAPGGIFQPLDLLGRPLSEPLEWADAEALLDAQTLTWLDGPWALRRGSEAEVLRVRIAEVSASRVVLVDDHGGAIGGPAPERYEVPVPVEPGVLEPWPAA